MNETLVCEDTGRQAVNGECPVHHGDACLWDVSQMRELYNNHVTLKANIRKLLDEDQSGIGRR